MSASKRTERKASPAAPKAADTTAFAAAGKPVAEVPPTHYVASDGKLAWRPEVLAAMRACRIPDGAFDTIITESVIGSGVRPNGESNGHAEHRRNEHAMFDSDDGIVLLPDRELRRLDDRLYMNSAQTEIWWRVGTGKTTRYRLDPNGAPALLKCVCPRGQPAREDEASAEVRYLIEWRWPNGDKIEPEWYSAAAIRRGDYFDRFGIARTGRKEIDTWAKIVLAQRRAFAVPIEYPGRYSGFSSADEAPAYTLRDGRILLPGGKIAPGTIAGEPPILQHKRRERWQDRFKDLPIGPSTAAQLCAAKDALLAYDKKGRPFCGTLLSLRSLFSSLVPMNISVLITGIPGTGKTTTAQIMHWAEGPCAARDEPDVTLGFGRATELGSELTGDRIRDSALLIDDGTREKPDPGAPLNPRAIKLISDSVRAAFDGSPLRVRGNRHLTLAQQHKIQQLLVFTAETAAGLDGAILARTVWWSFERNEIDRTPLVGDEPETPVWMASQETVTAISYALIRYILDIWATKDRAAAINFIRDIDRQAAKLAATADIGGTNEDRPRIRHGLAMILAGAILCDATVGTGTMMRDLALRYGAALAREQAEQLVNGTTTTGSFDLEWFRAAFEDLINGGEYVWLDAETGKFLHSREECDAHLIGLGYQWRGLTDGFVPNARLRAGWRHEGERQYWVEPAPLFAYLERRTIRQGGTFPFNRQTLPAHLIKIGATVPGNMGNRHKPYIPRSDGRDPDKGSQPFVLRVPFKNPKDDENERGERGDTGLNGCHSTEIHLLARPADFSSLSTSEETIPAEARRQNSKLNQDVTNSLLTLPALLASKTPSIDISQRETVSAAAGTRNNGLDQHLIEGVPAVAAANTPNALSAAESPRANRATTQTAPKATSEFATLDPDALYTVTANGWAENFAPRESAKGVPAPTLKTPRAAPEPVSEPHAAAPAIATTPHTAPATTQTRWPDRFAALDSDGLYLLHSDGTIERRPFTPELHPENACAGRLAAFMVPERVTQLWLHPSYTALTSFPSKISASAARAGINCEFATDLDMPAGWRLSHPGKITSWNSLTNGGQDTSIVAMSLDRETGLHKADDAPDTLTALHTFRVATGGFSYIRHPIVTFNKMLRMLTGLDLKADMAPAEFPPPMRAPILTDLCWLRELTGQEKAAGRHVFQWDKSGDYLGAAASLKVGLGRPEYDAAPVFDPINPEIGFWMAQITMPASWPTTLPNPAATRLRQNAGGFNWHVTPTLMLAAELGAKIEVNEAWLFNETHQPLTPLQKCLRDARQQLMMSDEPAARLALDGLVKPIYRKGFGGLSARKNREAERPLDLHRPDWNDFIIATSRANKIRNIRKAGLQPFAIRTDAIFVVAATDDPTIAAGRLAVGRKLGEWDYKGSLPLADLPVIDTRALKQPQRYLDDLSALIKLRTRGAGNGA